MPRLVDDVIGVFHASPLLGKDKDPRHIYRSILPFLPPSSPILVHYNTLSDPIKVLRVCSRHNNFQCGDPPTSTVTCTALSDDGHRIALGFNDGVVEVVDTELGTTISQSDGLPKPPVWLLFIDGGQKIVIETYEGDIYIWDKFTLRRQRFSSRINGSSKVVASLSHDGSMIVRAAQHWTKDWHENMCIIYITDDPTIHSLSTPSQIIPYHGRGRVFPLQHSVGFSPDGRYVAAFDTQQAFVWSTISFQLIVHYSIGNHHNWFLNTNRPSTMPNLAFPNDVIITPFPEHSGSIHSTSCILFNLALRRPANMRYLSMQALSLAAAAAPVLSSRRMVWFRGRKIMVIPDDYWNSITRPRLPPWEPPSESPSDSSFLTSKDGTRFLLYDKEHHQQMSKLGFEGYNLLKPPETSPNPPTPQLGPPSWK